MNNPTCTLDIPVPAASPVCDILPRPGSVLIVEAERDRLLTFSSRLNQVGLKVSIAHDVCAGVEAALYHSPDIIVLDEDLPGAGGAGVLRILRSVPSAREIPVVLMSSGSRQKSATRDAGHEMVRQVLEKPVTGARLARVVSAVLDEQNVAPPILSRPVPVH